MGKSRTRLPVAWYTALAIAAATPTSPISPTPFTPSGLTTVSMLFHKQDFYLRHIGMDGHVVAGQVMVDEAPELVIQSTG